MEPLIIAINSLRIARAKAPEMEKAAARNFGLEEENIISIFIYEPDSEAHALTDSLEKKIVREIPRTSVIINVDPCTAEVCPGRENCEMERSRIPQRFKNQPE